MGLTSKLKPKETMTIPFKEGTLYLVGNVADQLEFGMKPEVSYPYIFIYFVYSYDLKKIEQLPESSNFIRLGDGYAEARRHEGGFQIRRVEHPQSKIFSLSTFSKEEYEIIRKHL